MRRSSRRVRVLAGDEVIAETGDPAVLSETGLPNRFYVPGADVGGDVLVPSDTRAICPYKGEASYWSLEVNGRRIDDAAWSYEEPLESAAKVADHVCFLHDEVTVEVDGRALYPP